MHQDSFPPSSNQAPLRFPADFYWGAATASHQVEGDNHNDWSEWEKQNADHLAKEARSHFGHLPTWPLYKTEAENPLNYISGIGPDHYHRYEEDFDIAKTLGHNAHRFSLEWSRIEPTKGAFDQKEIAHYQAVIAALRKRGIEPFVTLWHWTLPVWLQKEGGLLSKNFPRYFERYARTIAHAFGNSITFIITLNEPDVVTSHGYLLGQWPPQKKGVWSFLRASYHLVQAHKKAYRILKAHNSAYQIGIAKHQVAFIPVTPSLWNTLLKTVADFFWNDLWLLAIKKEQDFLGLNHYHSHHIDGWYNKNKNEQVTDFGWEYYPESITIAALQLKKYKLPIYVTENGVADGQDTLRQDFLPRAIAALHAAMAQGADIRGYLHWSFIDNFEWDKGYWLKFGLIDFDHQTKERHIRPSAYLYQKIITNSRSS
jgi:beta-glucosidase